MQVAHLRQHWGLAASAALTCWGFLLSCSLLRKYGVLGARKVLLGALYLLGAGHLLEESGAGADLGMPVRSFPSALGGWFSFWKLCLGSKPILFSLVWVTPGDGGEWGMALGDTAASVCGGV